MFWLRNHRRTGQHPFGGADRVLPEWIRWGGSSRNFPRPIQWGGGSGRIFSVNVVTDPKFVLFQHVLCFARIISTLCPNWGAAAPRPVRLCP